MPKHKFPFISLKEFTDLESKRPPFIVMGDLLNISPLILLRDEVQGDWAGNLYEWRVDGAGAIDTKKGDLFGISATGVPLSRVTHWMPLPGRQYPQHSK